jgi:hypothetical protein
MIQLQFPACLPPCIQYPFYFSTAISVLSPTPKSKNATLSNASISNLEILEMVIPLPLQVIRVMLPSLLLIRIHIKALRIPRIPYRRDYRASIFPVITILPIHTLEEWVVFDALCTARDVA